MLKRIASASAGFLFAFVIAASLSLASGLVLTKARITEAIKDGFSSGALSQQERWTECAALTMQFVRHDGVILNALDTRWPRPQHHACDELQALVAGPPYPFGLNPPSSYVNYPFGARHLQSVALSALSMFSTSALYRVLSYASIVALFLGAWRNSPRLALLIVAPIALSLTFAFEQHRYADNTPWAPAFFVGFFVLGLFLAMRLRFQDGTRRLGFFFFLGTLISYFDHFQGSLPVILSLSIVLDHFFYAERDEDVRWFAAIRNALTIAVCFIAAFVLLTTIRLELLKMVVSDPVWPRFLHGLSQRMSSVTGDNPAIGVLDLILKLWAERKEMTGDETASTILLYAGLSAWILSLLSTLIFHLRQTVAGRTAGTAPTIGIFVLAIAGAGILLWYLLLPNHTLIHAWLMVRMLALPVAYGFAALMLSIMQLRETRTLRIRAA